MRTEDYECVAACVNVARDVRGREGVEDKMPGAPQAS